MTADRPDERRPDERRPVDSPFHRRLVPGTVFDGGPMIEHPSPSFASVELRPLDDMLEPERPRSGTHGDCRHCTRQDSWIWRDEHWHLSSWSETGMPFFGALAPNQHWLLDDAPAEVVASHGEVLQQVSRATKQIPGAARLHYGRFNDGSAHWHVQLIVRPTGMMQARGAMSYLWEGTLPVIPTAMFEEHRRIVATAMADWRGESLVG